MTDRRNDGGAWPNSSHTLRAQPSGYYEFADIGWQRDNGSYGRIAGFRRAAEILYDSIIQSRSIADLDTVIFPYATCWRHHLELQLKDVIVSLRALRDIPGLPANTHNLAALWEELRQMIRAEWPDDAADLRNVTRVIGQFTSMDPTGEGFRYDRDRKGKVTLGMVDRVDLPTFHESMIGLSNYLSGVDMHADNDLEVKRDMETYYAEAADNAYADEVPDEW